MRRETCGDDPRARPRTSRRVALPFAACTAHQASGNGASRYRPVLPAWGQRAPRVKSNACHYLASAVTPFQSSVRNGAAGRPAAL